MLWNVRLYLHIKYQFYRLRRRTSVHELLTRRQLFVIEAHIVTPSHRVGHYGGITFVSAIPELHGGRLPANQIIWTDKQRMKS